MIYDQQCTLAGVIINSLIHYWLITVQPRRRSVRGPQLYNNIIPNPFVVRRATHTSYYISCRAPILCDRGRCSVPVPPPRRRCPLRNCTRRSASSRRPCAVPTAANRRQSGASRCPTRCSASPASTCSRDASSSVHRRPRRRTVAVALWPPPPVASSCAWCACSGTTLWPANRPRTHAHYYTIPTTLLCTTCRYVDILIMIIILLRRQDYNI